MTEGNEHISALMDDDYDDQSLKQLVEDDELKQTWARYHLIGDCLRDTLPGSIDLELAQKVSSRLEAEPTVLAPQRKSAALHKPVVGFAIAASVALVAVLGIKQNTDPANPVATTPAIASNQTTVSQPATVNETYTFSNAPVRAASMSDTPESLVNQRMSGYLVNHNQYRSSGSMSGIRPYVRIVTIETQE